MRRRTCATSWYWLLLAPAALCAASGDAAEYTAAGSVRMEALYDNNIQWTIADAKSVSGRTLIPEFSLGAASETTTADLQLHTWFRRFSISDYDSDDQDLQLSVQHKLERQQFGLSFKTVRDSTLTSELLDSGRVADARRHTQNLLQPSWTYLLSEKNLLTAQGSYSVSKYSGEQYTNYDYWQASLRWTHVLSERLRLFLETDHSDYQSAQRPFVFGFLGLAITQGYATSSVDNSVQIGGDYALSEALQLSLQVGRTFDKTSYEVRDPLRLCSSAFAPISPLCSLQENRTQLSLLDSSLTWSAGERSQLSASASRQTQPSSDGYTLQSTQYNVNWRYQLWEAGTLSAAVTIGDNSVSGANKNSGLARQSDRRFRYATLAYTHQLNERWSLDCKYRYQYQKYDELDRSATSKAVYLGINYRPREWRWRR
jgi:hypothetical protein